MNVNSKKNTEDADLDLLRLIAIFKVKFIFEHVWPSDEENGRRKLTSIVKKINVLI